MKLNLKLISLLLILFFVTISFVSASEIDELEINDNNNVRVNDMSTENIGANLIQEKEPLSAANSKTFKDLNSEISKAEAGDTIVLDSDYVYNSGFTNNGITINKKLTIDGNGYTLDAKKSGRIFSITADNVILKNIIFVNGYKSDGAGAISCSIASKLTISNCTFKNNAADAIAGAVFLKNNGHKVIGCTFISNTASKSGGAIRLQGNNAIFENNVFKSNKVTGSDFLGGAICALGNNIIVKNNTFTSNVAGRDGGALDIEGSETEKIGKNNIITFNTFTSNSAKYGGAISANCQNITISNNIFNNNHATTSGLGGAIRIAGTKTNTGKITGNSFIGNYAPSGGTIFINGNGTSVSKNTFKNSKSTSASGGTINIRGNNNVVSQNDIDTSNSKGSGGAIYADGNNFKLTNNNITSATSGASGGAAYILSTGSTITGNIFNSNTASTLGGAIQVKGNKATLNTNKFISNTAKSNNGGAIYIESDNAVLKSNDFEGNSAKTGYSLYGKGSKPTISNNNLINIKDQSKELVWLNYNIPAQNKIDKKEPITPDNRAVTKIIYEDMNTAPVNIDVDGRIGNYFSVKLVDKNNNPLVGLPIKFGFNGKIYDKNTTSNGAAKLQINLPKEELYTFAVSFLGDDDYQGSFVVAKINVSKTNPKPNSANSNSTGEKANVTKVTNRLKTSISYSNMTTFSVLGADGRIGKYFIVKLLDNKGKSLSSLPIKIGFNGKIYNKTTASDGSAKVQINLARPTGYTFAICYLGNLKYQGSFAVAKITVKAQTPKLTSSAKTFKASDKTKSLTATLLTANSKPMKNQKISFTINGKSYTGTTDTKGVAAVKISLNKKGTYSCVIKYDGRVGCNAKSTKVTVKIN